MTRLIIVVALLTLSCGGSNPSSPSPTPAQASPAKASITLSVSPGSITATCVQTASLCAANVALTFTETGGVGATVTLITATMRTTAGVVADAASYDASKITTLAGSNRISGNGSLAIPKAGVTERIGCLWSQANGVGRTGTLTITVALTDDKGAAMSATATVPVA